MYRPPRRLLLSVGPVAAVFVIWDAIAIAGQVWTFNPRLSAILATLRGRR
ncbi:hypothetical protein [Mycolicibacterium vinylchloridicum]